ncbi:MAG: hypothetical protein JKY54_19290, partial [Flavobacteriales bacterium]|nr:hypothetical protein [Flavobacteriales bacterium]
MKLFKTTSCALRSTRRDDLTPKLRSKAVIFLLFLFFGGGSVFAQDQFLWTGAIDNNWTTVGNWLQLPWGGTTAVSASYYPGQISGNIGGPQDDVAMFNSTYGANCIINPSHSGTNGGLRVGGIQVIGYTGTISQSVSNRFLVAESVGASGTGFWDGTSTISTGYSGMALFTGQTAYRAYFDFGAGSGGFVGGTDPLIGGIVPSYAMLITVPLTVKTGSKFTAPSDELKIRNDATIETGSDFINSNLGTTVLDNRSGGSFTRYYDFGDVVFWDLKTSSSVHIMEFTGGIITTENSFLTAG